jgi:hypothetical protein
MDPNLPITKHQPPYAFCIECGKPSLEKPLAKCGQCLMVGYCNEKCQKKNRKFHKVTCCNLEAVGNLRLHVFVTIKITQEEHVHELKGCLMSIHDQLVRPHQVTVIWCAVSGLVGPFLELLGFLELMEATFPNMTTKRVKDVKKAHDSSTQSLLINHLRELPIEYFDSRTWVLMSDGKELWHPRRILNYLDVMGQHRWRNSDDFQFVVHGHGYATLRRPVERQVMIAKQVQMLIGIDLVNVQHVNREDLSDGPLQHISGVVFPISFLTPFLVANTKSFTCQREWEASLLEIVNSHDSVRISMNSKSWMVFLRHNPAKSAK